MQNFLFSYSSYSSSSLFVVVVIIPKRTGVDIQIIPLKLVVRDPTDQLAGRLNRPLNIQTLAKIIGQVPTCFLYVLVMYIFLFD